MVVDKSTFPLGGLVNHKVHLFIKGCFTLKLSLSWKTVICSPSAAGFVFSFELPVPSGEIGMVDKSTCSPVGAATAAIFVFYFRS